MLRSPAIAARESVAAHNARGLAFYAQGRHSPALVEFEAALRLRPADVDAHFNRGNALLALRRLDDALAAYDETLQLAPRSEPALNNRGSVLCKLGRYEDAIASYDRALRLNPHYLDARFNRALALQSQRRFVEALVDHDLILLRRADYPRLHVHRAYCQRALHRPDDALRSCDLGLVVNPRDTKALVCKGEILQAAGRRAEAHQLFRAALRLEPNLPYVAGLSLAAKLGACDWQEYETSIAQLRAAVRTGRPAAYPWDFATLVDDPNEQLLCARTFVQDRCPGADPLWRGERYVHDRIRIAYLSADFHDHATICLMAGLFERHDRTRFETIAVSFSPSRPSVMRSRVEPAFDRFIDVGTRSDIEVARLLRSLEIDVAVDLKGFTGDCRPGILALRPAPVQVSYLGYPGTMGCEFIDYLLADRTLITPELRQQYAEKIVYLPDSYQVNDDVRPFPDESINRQGLSLPAQAFVFCSFNHPFKINPPLFDVWMRLLKNVPGSVLWLYRGDEQAVTNLRREADRRGVDPSRLIFAPRVSLDEHIARHAAADLFLDNVPCNGHTTASDCLRAGLPMVTCAGNSFAARVGASLLHAVGLPELITSSLTEYEALALRLAMDAQLLGAIRTKLQASRRSSALFDTERFRIHLELAYELMVERIRSGAAPTDFSVVPLVRQS